MTMVVNDKIRVFIQDGFRQISNPFGSSKTTVILYTENYILAGNIEDLLTFRT